MATITKAPWSACALKFRVRRRVARPGRRTTIFEQPSLALHPLPPHPRRAQGVGSRLRAAVAMFAEFEDDEDDYDAVEEETPAGAVAVGPGPASAPPSWSFPPSRPRTR